MQSTWEITKRDTFLNWLLPLNKNETSLGESLCNLTKKERKNAWDDLEILQEYAIWHTTISSRTLLFYLLLSPLFRSHASVSLFNPFSSLIFRPLSSPLSCCSKVLKFLMHRLLVQSAKLFLLCRPFMGQLRGSQAYHQLPSVVFAPALAWWLDLNEG